MVIPLEHSLYRTVDSGEFVTAADMNTYLRLSTTGHNSMLSDLIKAARQQVEVDTRRAYLQQTFQLKLDSFPVGGTFIELPRPPLSSVSSITYITASDTTATWSSASYEVDTKRTPGVVFLDEDNDWPSAKEARNAVTVTYVAGYTTAAASVPQRAHLAVKMLVADWYNCPGLEGPANRDAYLNLIHGLRWGDYV